MRGKSQVKLSLYLVFFILPATASAQAADSLAQMKIPATKTDALGGRLTLSVPSQTKSQAMQHGIMAAPESDFEQTRIVIDAGEQRMVLMVYELFARAGTDLEGSVQKETSRFPVKVNLQKWPLSAALQAVAYFPVAPTKDEEANLVMGVFVAQLDGSVQNLVWYVNRAAAAQFDAALSLAKAMAKTIASGNRGLNSSPGERELSAYSKTKGVFITAPEGYVVTAQRGPDFIVHHIHKLTVFGDSLATIGVYLGDHPSAEHEGFAEEGTSVLFGKQAHWYRKTTNEDGQTVIQARALVPLGPALFGHVLPGVSSGPSYADIFLAAGDASTVEELKSIAATLRVGDRHTQP